ncbi:MAG: hypothetical protein ACOWWM_21220 [Desulfobacterales bacterium]
MTSGHVPPEAFDSRCFEAIARESPASPFRGKPNMMQWLTFAASFVQEDGGPQPPTDVIDLDRHGFNDITIGSPSARVRADGVYEHFEEASLACRRSVEIGTENDTVDYILVNWADPEAPELPAFEGKVRFRGRDHAFSRDTTRGTVLALLGAPYWIDEDADESILFYEFGEIEWQVEFDANQRLKVFLISTPPLLADSEQRRLYGVDREWPPEPR